jgi:hypothetical protein
VLLGLQPLTTTAYLLRVLPANKKIIAGMARSYTFLLTLPIAHVIGHLGECGRQLLTQRRIFHHFA